MAATLGAAGHAGVGRRKETRAERGANLVLKKEVQVSTTTSGSAGLPYVAADNIVIATARPGCCAPARTTGISTV
jgi:hypothetical protein